MNDSIETKLARLRKLWKFAKSQGKENLAAQIEKDAKKLKETDDTYERALEVFSPKS